MEGVKHHSALSATEYFLNVMVPDTVLNFRRIMGNKIDKVLALKELILFYRETGQR